MRSADGFHPSFDAGLPAVRRHLLRGFPGGDNQADGLGPETAWKHSPGDRNATGNPATVELQPGDTIVFKGGVPYIGEIQLSVAGSEDQPITLDGNAAGTFGEGRAILDGARMITDWQRCQSAEQVQGNPRWKEILYADLDVDLSSNFGQGRFVAHRDAGEARQAPWQRLFLVDGERRVLPIAQVPKPSDPFYPDLPADFYNTPHPLTDDYPHQVYYEEGTIGNRTLPLIAITFGGNAPVIQPFHGGAVSVEMNEPATIAEIGFTLFRPATTPVPEHIAFLADGREILQAEVDPEQSAMQRFTLAEPVAAHKLTFQLRHSDPGNRTWTKLQQIAAFTPDGTNVIEHPISSIIRDEARLRQEDPRWYDGNAERLVFRNNVIDGRERSAVAVAMWNSGRVGGREIKDIHFFHNTFVNPNPDTAWATGILGQRRGSPSPPQGLIIRHNILYGLAEDISGEIENNLYTREVEERFMGPGCQVVRDPESLFRDPARGDYRRRPGGPAMEVGADIPPAPGVHRGARVANGSNGRRSESPHSSPSRRGESARGSDAKRQSVRSHAGAWERCESSRPSKAALG